MIDLHSHILPGVDDGAVSVDMALDMLDMAYRDGTDAIVLTPHYDPESGYDNPREKIAELFDQFRYIVHRQGIPIDLYLGCEYLMADVRRFREEWKDIQTLQDTRYLLMEFYFDVSEREILRAIDAVREQGLIPVIAHPERYECIKVFPGFGAEINRSGALLQMNTGSPLGMYGKLARQAAMELLDHRQYALVGSDAHRPKGRDPRMGESFDYLSRCFGYDYCNRIFRENPEEILHDGEISEVYADEEN